MAMLPGGCNRAGSTSFVVLNSRLMRASQQGLAPNLYLLRVGRLALSTSRVCRLSARVATTRVAIHRASHWMNAARDRASSIASPRASQRAEVQGCWTRGESRQTDAQRLSSPSNPRPLSRLTHPGGYPAPRLLSVNRRGASALSSESCRIETLSKLQRFVMASSCATTSSTRALRSILFA